MSLAANQADQADQGPGGEQLATINAVGGAQDQGGQAVAMFLGVALGDERAHAVAQQVQWQARKLRTAVLDHPVQIGNHVGPAVLVGIVPQAFGRTVGAVAPMVEGDNHHVALAEPFGQCPVTVAVFGHAMADNQNAGGLRRNKHSAG